MKLVGLAEFIEDFIADIDTKILTLTEDQIDNYIIKEIHDESDVLKQLLIEVEKKRLYYSQKQYHYDYSAFKSAAIYMTVGLGLLYLLYFIITNYRIPLEKEFTALAKELESLGVTVIQSKTEEEITLVTEASKRFTQTEAVVVKDLIDQIYHIDSKLQNGAIAWAKSIITIIFALMMKTTLEYIHKWIWPKYKQRYEKYCLIEQKLHKAIHIGL